MDLNPVSPDWLKQRTDGDVDGFVISVVRARQTSPIRTKGASSTQSDGWTLRIEFLVEADRRALSMRHIRSG